MKRVAIIGGGVSGLTVAFELLNLGFSTDDIVLLEKNSSVGGNLRTHREQGYVIEEGPNGFLDNSPATLDLVKRLGIEDSLLQSNSQAGRRFIFRKGKMREIKAHPIEFLTSGVLPIWGALRVALEPFQKKGGSPKESVANFATRRIGKSASKNLVAAMVQGVFAGDAGELELKSAFPKMYAMEQQYGSLVKAMIKKSKQKKIHGGPAGPAGKLTSFFDGMATLPNALAANLLEVIQTQKEVGCIEKQEHGFRIKMTSGDHVNAQSVVLANPAWNVSSMIHKMDRELAKELRSIYYPPVMVVATGYRVADLAHKPDGFGFLVPREQGIRILGCLWSSSVWQNRAPADHVLLRTMVGGSMDAKSSELDDEALVALVCKELETTMGISAKPHLTKVFRHQNAIAQYECGHGERIARIEKQFLSHSGLFLSGSSYGGISVNHCIDEAPRVAKAISTFLDEKCSANPVVKNPDPTSSIRPPACM